MYESELTKFMREYLEQHPEERESQKTGRAIWWDHAGDQRTPPDPARHSPKAGGNEYLFNPLSDKEQIFCLLKVWLFPIAAGWILCLLFVWIVLWIRAGFKS